MRVFGPTNAEVAWDGTTQYCDPSPHTERPMKARFRVPSMLALGSLLVMAPSLAGQSATGDPAAPRTPRTEAADSGIKSVATGVAWSIGGVVVPIAAAVLVRSNDGPNDGPTLLGFAGFLIGPSLGHFYAGRTGRGLGGIGARLVVTVGAIAAVGATWNSNSFPSSEAYALGVLVLGAVAASTIWDIARVPGSVRRHNVAARSTGLTLAITPIAGASRLGIGGRVTF